MIALSLSIKILVVMEECWAYYDTEYEHISWREVSILVVMEECWAGDFSGLDTFGISLNPCCNGGVLGKM